MQVILRRIVAGALFLGAIAVLGTIPVKDNLLPAVDTYGEEAFLVQLLLLCVVCVVGGFVVLPKGKQQE